MFVIVCSQLFWPFILRSFFRCKCGHKCIVIIVEMTSNIYMERDVALLFSCYIIIIIFFVLVEKGVTVVLCVFYKDNANTPTHLTNIASTGQRHLKST